eukprot:5552755-Alexandrium_andersonii.AAC.1
MRWGHLGPDAPSVGRPRCCGARNVWVWGGEARHFLGPRALKAPILSRDSGGACCRGCESG